MLSGAELARRCFVTPQTMNQIVAGLEARALVQRAPHPTHRRILQISLSERGRTLLVEAHRGVGAVESRMTAGAVRTRGARTRSVARRLRQRAHDRKSPSRRGVVAQLRPGSPQELG
ncbi:MarR family winged helix-turn-helix transcriptional regulator [Actinopolymorpha pittospori]|uniref:MarR family winged helix-turn-helix transcriptional regulator n=1 Tax=Actinopolymorpha pittospori TaxID=648752 RepID=UPI003B588FC0